MNVLDVNRNNGLKGTVDWGFTNRSERVSEDGTKGLNGGSEGYSVFSPRFVS